MRRDYNNNIITMARAVHDQSGTSRPNECDTGHWVYANIEASRTVMLRKLGVHRWKHYYYYYCYYYSASDICSFSSGRALCGTRGDLRSDTYAAHTPIRRRRHRHTINIIVFSFIALSE